ncbi:MAG TPA: hypothetical protein ENH35_04555 [Candidatus Moranbacteria bacterium]|nr:hypothetical protein [Candidatus Moranbacteria bacterium]
MDTDDLSNETYKAVILEAEKFNHDLTLQFGVMASSCKTEEEYLQKAKQLINEIRELDNYDLEDLFFGTLPDKKLLEQRISQIEQNIAEVETIPKQNRHYEF